MLVETPKTPEAMTVERYGVNADICRCWFAACLVALWFAGAQWCSAAAAVSPPDLTKGGKPINTKGAEVDPLESDINLGPTGAHGWIYHVSVDSSMSRQILVTEVEKGSPAEGILQPNDVILGVDGTGAAPKPFASDPRVALGMAIGDAEAKNPAKLQLLYWRAGKQGVAVIPLQTFGPYAPTAPYGCTKSAKILEQGLRHVMTNQNEGVWSMNALTLLAANDPANPANAERQAKAKEWAEKQILSQEEIDKRLAGYVSTDSKVGWTRGHQLLVLAEYYLQSGDARVLPTIEAMAVEICNGFSLLGTMGHQFTNPVLNGRFNGPYNIGYGVINSAGLPSYYGLLLARKCGVKRPELDPAIARATNFFGSYVGYGAIPYGEHLPARGYHENNGKMGLAALAFSVEGSRAGSAKYFSRMAAASASEREVGHCGAYFNYLWAPLGANVGGKESAASHFKRISWRLDLNRRWDGGFAYDCWYHYTTGGPKYAGRDFWASIPMLLTYAMPLKQLTITGKLLDGKLDLTKSEVAQTVFADHYDASKRTSAELIEDLGIWSPKVQEAAAKELAKRSAERATLIPQLIAIAKDTSAGERRAGACFALGEMKDGSAAADLADLLTDGDEKVRWAAANAMRYMPKDAQTKHLATILKAAATTVRPFDPLTDKNPLQFAHSQLCYLLFYNGTAYGPSGIIAGDRLAGVDRKLLYPAIEAVATTPLGHARSCLGGTFKFLTPDDVKALSGTLLDVAMVPAPADKMFKAGSQTAALSVLEDHRIAEGLTLTARLAKDRNFSSRAHALDELAAFASSSIAPGSDADLLKLCEVLKQSEPDLAGKAQAVIDAMAKQKTPLPMTQLKSIQAVTAKPALLQLPAKTVEISVDSEDLAKGDAIYTWRKVHGAGKVVFAQNGTAAAKNTTVQFDGVPGKYLFEVTMSDSRGLSEATARVAVVLQDAKGRLPANRAPVAKAKSVVIPQSTTTPVMLQGSDPEGLALGYAVTQVPKHGRLSGTAPDLRYTPDYGYAGADSFAFEVTDSEGQTASAVITVKVDGSEPLRLAIYEPFDYPTGPLNGQSGSSEAGFDGVWNAHPKNAMIAAGSLSYGKLLVKGGKYQTDGGNAWGGTRAISPAALKANGFLDDGATLWFSAMVGFGPKSSYKWDRLSFALANHGFHEGNATTWILDDGGQPGTGVGFTMAKHDASTIGGRVQATCFGGGGAKAADAARPSVHGSWLGAVTLIPQGGQGLVIGRFTWAADPTQPDRIEIFGPMPDLELPSAPVSELSVVVDQSAFDTLTFDKGGDVLLDEIRFGPTYESVLAGTAPIKAAASAKPE